MAEEFVTWDVGLGQDAKVDIHKHNAEQLIKLCQAGRFILCHLALF
jgi:hypothetical protein